MYQIVFKPEASYINVVNVFRNDTMESLEVHQ